MSKPENNFFANQSLNGDSPTPLYRQLQQLIRDAVGLGTIQIDDAIPAERDIASDLGISRVTVRKAVSELVDEGLLVQRQGAGTFVKGRMEQPMSKLTGFTEEMARRGMVPGVKWLDRSVGVASPEEAMALNISPGTEVSRLARVRFGADKPVAVEYTTVPKIFLPSPNLVTLSLYDILNITNFRPYRALQRLRAELFSKEMAEQLELDENAVALFIERRSFLRDGRAVEFTRSYYRGDSYDFVAELQLDMLPNTYSNSSNNNEFTK